MNRYDFSKFVKYENTKGAVEFGIKLFKDPYCSFFSSSLMNEYLADFIIGLVESNNVVFIQNVLQHLKEKDCILSSKILGIALGHIYKTPQPFRNIKIILDYCDKTLSTEAESLFLSAIQRQDYDMLCFLHNQNLKCTMLLQNLVTHFDYQMLTFMVLKLKYNWFDSVNNLIIILKCLDQWSESIRITTDMMLDKLKMMKFIFEKGGSKQEVIENLKSSTFFKYLQLQKKVENRMANRIYFWIYPILYRNKEFALKQGERSYNAIFL
jgi:hypothetical protein